MAVQLTERGEQAISRHNRRRTVNLIFISNYIHCKVYTKNNFYGQCDKLYINHSNFNYEVNHSAFFNVRIAPLI